MKDEIKEVFMFILLGGKEIKTEPLYNMLTLLCDKSDISWQDGFKEVSLNSTTLFVEKCFKMIKNELYDDFIEYYKSLLLKNENYELINYLSL